MRRPAVAFVPARGSRPSLLTLILLAAGAVLLPPALAGRAGHVARADIAGEAYQDFKGVIEDLLTAEITRALVPQIVCRAGRQENPPGASCDDPSTICFERRGEMQRIKLKMLEYFPATLQAIYSRRFAALRSTVASEVIDVAADTFYDSMLVTLQDLSKMRAAMQSSAVQLAIEYANEIAPAGDTLFTSFDAESLGQCVEKITEKLNAGLVTTISRIDRDCSPSRHDKALACELAQALRLALRGKGEESEARIHRGLAIILAKGLLSQPAVTGERPQPGRDGLVKILADELTGLLHQLGGGSLSSAAQDELFAAFTARASALLGIDPAKIGAMVTSKRGAFTRLVARLEAVTDGGAVKLTIELLISDLAEVLRGPGSLCDQQEESTCKFLEREELSQRIGISSSVWPAVTAAGSGDLRGVAHLVLSALFRRSTDGRRCDRQSDSEECKLDAYRRFADSMVMYVLDSAEGDASLTVRSVFRQAATEVVRFISPFGGIDRGEPLLWLTPELALRASWSAGYPSDGGDRFRYVAGVNMLRLRKVLVYTDRSYASLQLSLLDPIAPLAELALRPDLEEGSDMPIEYEDNARLLLNVISPRFELTAALPWLSKHLAASAGVGLRLVVPTAPQAPMPMLGEDGEPIEDSGDDGTLTSRYRTLFDAGDDWYEHVEFGFSLKYLL